MSRWEWNQSVGCDEPENNYQQDQRSIDAIVMVAKDSKDFKEL